MVSFEWDPQRAKEIAWEEGYMEGFQEGFQEGLQEERKEGRREARENIIPRVVLNLFRKRYSISYIADTIEISEVEVKQILLRHGIAF